MSISNTKAAFMKAIRETVKAKASANGIRLTKEELNEIVLQQATDAINGTGARELNARLNQLLEIGV